MTPPAYVSPMKSGVDACLNMYTKRLVEASSPERLGRVEACELLIPKLVALLRCHERAAETESYDELQRSGLVELFNCVSGEIRACLHLQEEADTSELENDYLYLQGKIEQFREVEERLVLCCDEMDGQPCFTVLNFTSLPGRQLPFHVGLQRDLTEQLSEQEGKAVRLEVYNVSAEAHGFDATRNQHAQVEAVLEALGWTSEMWREKRLVLAPPVHSLYALLLVEHLKQRLGRDMLLLLPGIFERRHLRTGELLSQQDYIAALVPLEREMEKERK